jgi:hypothetical protein
MGVGDSQPVLAAMDSVNLEHISEGSFDGLFCKIFLAKVYYLNLL